MKTKKILGLDLGVSSIGWSLIALNEKEEPAEILGMGSRIVPLSTEDADEFQKGAAISKNSRRTLLRTMRKGINRYQQRRTRLTRILQSQGMLPTQELIQLPTLELWELRAKAATAGEKLTLAEIGRVLYHLNQKRGYKHAKGDSNPDEDGKGKKETDYVAAVKGRYHELRESNLTIGQHFAQALKSSEQIGEHGPVYTYRIKDQVYPREAYIEEFDQIMEVQSAFYPEKLNKSLIQELRSTIYLQRPLKSCKGLVSYCEFEKKQRLVKVRLAGKEGEEIIKEQLVDIGPKVAPKSSPLAEVCRIWETLNNIRIYFPDGSDRPISIEEKQRLFEELQTTEKLPFSKVKKLLKIKAQEETWTNDLLKGGIKGNATCQALRKAFADYSHYAELLSFDLLVKEGNADPDTGELRLVIDEGYQQTPLFKLWHILYSIEDREAMGRALEQQLGITRKDLDAGLLDKLFQIDFTKQGYTNKSSKFICKILPYLQQGYMYSEACELAGKRHSAASLTTEEIDERPLLDMIPILPRNALRQPIVEKILNQMINLVNELRKQHGEIEEVRIELARELKMSREERAQATKNINKNKKENEQIAKLIEEHQLYPTRSRIQKYKMWKETNEQCIYCGKQVNLVTFLRGEEVEVEHIIPRSVLYDDSLSNKTCSCRACNHAKGNRTAMEYIQTLDTDRQDEYFKRVQKLFEEKKISYAKRSRLLMTTEDIPQDFIERHRRLSQYIAREAQHILRQGIRRVYASEGSVTATLRHLWGYDEILKDLNFDRYKSMGETEVIEVGGKLIEQIKDWTKRRDHRHHAIDALIVACTRQSYIQRLNRVNSEEDRDEMNDAVKGKKYKEKQLLLERWLIAQPHLSTQQVKDKVSQILISFRPGKRTYSRGKNKFKQHGKTLTQLGILIPRGALSEETVYGQILDGKGVEQIVVKYPLHSIQTKDLPYVVDQGLRRLLEERLTQYSDDPKKAFAEPLYSDRDKTQQIRSVRCFTGREREKMIPLRFDEQGKPISFVAPGSNHHVALYRDSEGKAHESIVTFWHAIERLRYGLPIIIKDPAEAMKQAQSIPDLPEAIHQKLPNPDWKLIETLSSNEMFLIGMTDEEIQQAISLQDYSTLSKHLYRVQKLTSNDYYFRYHLETMLAPQNNPGTTPKYYRVTSFKRYTKLNPRKVHINILGQITLI